FLARYQTGFMLLGLGLWMLFIDKIKPLNLLYILIGGVISLFIGVGFDWWLYDSPTVSSWNYFMWHLNAFRSGSGIDVVVYEPWWFYIQYGALQILPPLTLLLPLAVIVFWFLFPKHPITWLTIPFVLFHQYFGHKEMRYLFPVLPFAPVMFSLVLVKTNEYFNLLKNKFINYSWKCIFGISVFLNLILVILVLSIPASKEVALWQKCLAPLSTDYKPVLLVLDPDGSGSNTAELNLDFYNANNLIIDSVNNETGIVTKAEQYPEYDLFFASRKRDRSLQLDEANIQHELLCQALPDWILKININNWTSRASMWRIWAVSPSG
ncbi:MAG: hypothetical protein MI865_02220, partial [Proteobacteria bacterium]|nr:hypothetical protein [Pseudomonadota bacterium]